MKEKNTLRREVLQRLKAAAKADPAQLRSARLREALAPCLMNTRQLCLGIYAPLPHEVNLLPLLQKHPQHRYAFPRCLAGHQLEFSIVNNFEEDMEPGAMGIPAPRAHTERIRPEDIDLLIVPGVAFTRSGDRIGYGGGYYDRFIPLCTKADVMALAFEEQILPELPVEKHDLRIAHLITAAVT